MIIIKNLGNWTDQENETLQKEENTHRLIKTTNKLLNMHSKLIYIYSIGYANEA